MRKVVRQLVWQEVLENSKKNILCYSVALIIFICTYAVKCKVIPYSRYLDVFVLVLIVLTVSTIKILPFPIPKGIYVCPVDENSKLHYMYMKVWARTIQYMLVCILYMRIFTDYSTAENKIVWYPFQAMLVFFIALYFSVRLGKNEKAMLKLDENGDHICSDLEETMCINFGIILIIEWIFFVFFIGFCEARKAVGGIMLLIFLLINVIFMAKNLKPYLQELIVYEKFYSCKSKEDASQNNL